MLSKRKPRKDTKAFFFKVVLDDNAIKFGEIEIQCYSL